MPETCTDLHYTKCFHKAYLVFRGHPAFSVRIEGQDPSWHKSMQPAREVPNSSAENLLNGF